MSSVEKNITQQNIERARVNPEFEKRQEIEHKLIPANPEIVAFLYKADGVAIKQIYLSSPDEEFSLRVRQVGVGEHATYSATLKDRGELIEGALKRTEVETPISAEVFAFYEAADLPRIDKVRTELLPGLVIDFYDDEDIPVVIEVEGGDTKSRAEQIVAMQEMVGPLTDKSGDPSLGAETLAHKAYHKQHPETLHQTPETLDHFAERMLKDIVAQYVSGKNQVVATLGGLPGSGKTTVANHIQARIVELFGESFRPNVISTDDYHFGKTYLENQYGAPYVDWDDARTYNVTELAADLELHAQGVPLIKRRFDFDSEEAVFERELPHSPFVIVEGLYAGSPELSNTRDIHGELPTPKATSTGRSNRRLMIDKRANRAFPMPENRLRHDVETVLPLFWEHKQPEEKPFSACVRPMADRAFMLYAL